MVKGNSLRSCTWDFVGLLLVGFRLFISPQGLFISKGLFIRFWGCGLHDTGLKLRVYGRRVKGLWSMVYGRKCKGLMRMKE